MNKFKFRAECLTDVVRFFEQVGWVKYTIETVHGFPDCTVTFEYNGGVSTLRDVARMIPDGHVIVETLAPLADYTGERGGAG